MSRRDKDLGDALRRLEVPEHAADFFTELDRALDALTHDTQGERETRPPVVPAEKPAEMPEAVIETRITPVDAPVVAPAAQPDSNPEDAQPDSNPEDAPDTPETPAPPTGRRERRTISRRLLVWGVLAAATVALTLVAFMFMPGEPPPEQSPDEPVPEVTLATQAKTRLARALRDASSLRGVLVLASKDSPDSPLTEMRWDFALDTAGGFRVLGANTLPDGRTRTEILAYDTTRSVERSFTQDATDDLYGVERTGLAAGLPDPGPSDWILQRGLGSVVRALLASDDPGVVESTHDDRPVWVLDAPVEPNLISAFDGDRLEVTVDQATGFPVRVIESLAGDVIREYRLEDLQIDPILSPVQFGLTFPERLEVFTEDSGFRRVELAGAAPVVGYEPLVPAWLPEGFTLALVTVAESAQSTGKEGANPESRDVVSMMFRRGFDRLIISTRSVGADPTAWTDPLAGGEGFVDRPESYGLEAGAFAGRRAEVLIDPRSTPHLWSMNDDLVLTVAGDLSREELIAVAESLPEQTTE